MSASIRFFSIKSNEELLLLLLLLRVRLIAIYYKAWTQSYCYCRRQCAANMSIFSPSKMPNIMQNIFNLLDLFANAIRLQFIDFVLCFLVFHFAFKKFTFSERRVPAQFLLYVKRFLVLNFLLVVSVFFFFFFLSDSYFAFTLLFNLTLNLEIKCT